MQKVKVNGYKCLYCGNKFLKPQEKFYEDTGYESWCPECKTLFAFDPCEYYMDENEYNSNVEHEHMLDLIDYYGY